MPFAELVMAHGVCLQWLRYAARLNTKNHRDEMPQCAAIFLSILRPAESISAANVLNGIGSCVSCFRPRIFAFSHELYLSSANELRNVTTIEPLQIRRSSRNARQRVSESSK